MSTLQISQARKAFGRVDALDGLDLAIPEGTLAAILGPSGCGKTTLLRCVAGFERLDAGEIRVGDRPVSGPGTHVPSHRRNVAIVPQEGALFPHLTVADNVAYGLGRAQRRSGRVAELLALVGLADHGSRWPHELSGGQQQRVAVARALAPRPALILLDEPFSALDATLRGGLRRDIRAALRADSATAVLITHDQDEALSTADQVAVMRAGAIVQTGTPAEVYRTPGDPWVARFLGEAVLLPATAAPGGADTPLGTLKLGAPAPASAFTVLLRPEQISAADTGVAAVVTGIDYHGHDTLLALELADSTAVTSRVAGQSGLTVGARVCLRVDGEALAY